MGIKIAIVAAMLIACLSGVFYWYYNDTQARIASLRENNAKLEVAVNTAESSLDLVKTEMAKVGELNNQLQKSIVYSKIMDDRNVLPHVRSFFLVRTSSPTCTVPLFIFELSVPILPHVQFHPNMHSPFLAPARISKHCSVSGLG